MKMQTNNNTKYNEDQVHLAIFFITPCTTSTQEISVSGIDLNTKNKMEGS